MGFYMDECLAEGRYQYLQILVLSIKADESWVSQGLVLEKKKKWDCHGHFAALIRVRKKSKELTVCLRGLKGGYPVIHTPIYSERQGSQAWNNLRPHVGTYQKTGKNRTPEWLNVCGYSGRGMGAVGRGHQGWQLEGKEQEEKGRVKGTLLL